MCYIHLMRYLGILTKPMMNGYDNKTVKGEILRASKDHSAAAYLKVISPQSVSALPAPRAPLSLLNL